jgi:hypothetical protein
MEDTILSNAVIKVKGRVEGTPSSNPELVDPNSGSTQVDPMVTSFFKLDELSLTNAQKEKINEISDWAKQKSDGEPLNYMNVLRDIRFRLGATPIGRSDLDIVHQYVRLRASAQKLLDQAKVMEQ